MRNYFVQDRGHKVLNEGLGPDLPIQAKKVEWKQTQDSSALIRTYEFKNDKFLREFVNELLSMQEYLEHHAQILIEKNVVKVRVGTHTLNRVTELDTEYAAKADQVYYETAGQHND
jgi:pterin-4a-carbinolamine dehydratase